MSNSLVWHYRVRLRRRSLFRYSGVFFEMELALVLPELGHRNIGKDCR